MLYALNIYTILFVNCTSAKLKGKNKVRRHMAHMCPKQTIWPRKEGSSFGCRRCVSSLEFTEDRWYTTVKVIRQLRWWEFHTMEHSGRGWDHWEAPWCLPLFKRHHVQRGQRSKQGHSRNALPVESSPMWRWIPPLNVSLQIALPVECWGW